MQNLDDLKAQVNLLVLAARHTHLKKVASSGGGEWAGPCPFCGGVDRFRVQPFMPEGGRWLCRRCTEGRWQDVISFGQHLWPGIPFREVISRLGGSALTPVGESRRSRRMAPPVRPAYTPPPADWQEQAQQALAVCAQHLWAAAGTEARAYLAGRKLEEETLHRWRIGFSPGAKFGDLWLPRGVVIPCVVHGEVWYFKIALLPDDPVRCQGCHETVPARRACPHCATVNKYRGVKGNRPAAIFGADDLVGAWAALFVEGEFDALIAWQELKDVIAVCTLGSATNQPDLATWGPYLLQLENILAAYDADPAGQAGEKMLAELSDRVLRIPLPPGAKDLNDFVLAGGALWPWLRAELVRLDLV